MIRVLLLSSTLIFALPLNAEEKPYVPPTKEQMEQIKDAVESIIQENAELEVRLQQATKELKRLNKLRCI